MKELAVTVEGATFSGVVGDCFVVSSVRWQRDPDAAGVGRWSLSLHPVAIAPIAGDYVTGHQHVAECSKPAVEIKKLTEECERLRLYSHALEARLRPAEPILVNIRMKESDPAADEPRVLPVNADALSDLRASAGALLTENESLRARLVTMQALAREADARCVELLEARAGAAEQISCPIVSPRSESCELVSSLRSQLALAEERRRPARHRPGEQVSVGWDPEGEP